ncbi:endonuclease domain-containing protein [Mycolicibacterium sp. CBM1]
MHSGNRPFVGSAALASGALSRHQLRSRFARVLPDIYLPRDGEPSLRDRIAAAWLWSGGAAVIAGLAAAALHGARWIADDVPVELIHANARAPAGVVTRRALLHSGEVQALAGFRVTTAERTAFDLGRLVDQTPAVARLDALARATRFRVDDVSALARNHPGVRGLRRLESVLELVDPGAESPRETYLRLTLVRGGLPRPHTQIPVFADGTVVAYLDMGWPELMIAVEYDGDHHRTDRRQYVRDIRRQEMLEDLGWVLIRVVAEDRPADILRRVHRAIAARESTVR